LEDLEFWKNKCFELEKENEQLNERIIDLRDEIIILRFLSKTV